MRTGFSLLYRRNGIYRFRRVVPKELREIIGRREIKVSLRTNDPQVAKRRAAQELLKADRLLEQARKSPADFLKQKQTASARAIVQENMADLLARPRDDDELDAIADALRRKLKRENDPVQIRALQTLLDKVPTVYEGGEGEREDVPLSVVFARWRAERQPPPRTWQEWQKARDRFAEAVGGDLSVAEITKRHVRAFKDALMRTTRRHGDQALSPASIQKNLSALRSVLSWAVAQGYIDDNPAQGVTHAGAKRAQLESGRLPYSEDDLKKLFSAEACEARKAKPADHWLPWLALYTGARLEELGQLRTDDVRREDGVDFLAIEPGDGKRVKTRGSQRRVPLHPELVRLGFLDYVARQRSEGQARLFPDLKAPAGRPLTAMWSKWYGRHRQKVCGITDPRKPFHSFRHAFIDAARLVMEEEHRNAITGHSNGAVGRGYGIGVPLKVLAESMAKVCYRGLTG